MCMLLLLQKKYTRRLERRYQSLLGDESCQDSEEMQQEYKRQRFDELAAAGDPEHTPVSDVIVCEAMMSSYVCMTLCIKYQRFY